MATKNAKVVLFGETLMDITDTTAEPSKVLSDSYFYDKAGVKQKGTCTYDADTSDATASQSQILYGQTAYANGTKLTGSMQNRGAVSGQISTKNESYTIPVGYHDGSGTVSILQTAVSQLKPENIRSQIQILGVTGTMEEGSECVAQAKEATPSLQQQIIQPDSGYTHLTQVTVKAIPVNKQVNAQGGYTVTIG